MSDDYIKIVEKATKQLQYDILCLGDEEILVLSRLIHGYLKDQGIFPEFKENGEPQSMEEKAN